MILWALYVILGESRSLVSFLGGHHMPLHMLVAQHERVSVIAPIHPPPPKRNKCPMDFS